MTNTHTVYLALGSNLGNGHETIARAIRKIGVLIGDVVRQSTLIETEPWGFGSENKFVNGCICVTTDLSPRELLQMTQLIERELGRSEKSSEGVYHDRTIDIDILLYDDLTVDEPDLKIPHPLMKERDFVMVPLREILK